VTLHDGERRFTQVQAVMPSPIRFGSYLFDRTAGSDFIENRLDRGRIVLADFAARTVDAPAGRGR
jgi:hypothetical protein